MTIGITELYNILTEIQKHKEDLDTIDFNRLGEDLKIISETMKKNYPAILEIVDCVKNTHEEITHAVVTLYPVVKKIIEIIKKNKEV
jgi:hypothetical protein